MSRKTTQRAIAYSLKELLLEKPLSKITINDIANKCDINRQTFYYHFHDITDLIEWICLEDADKVLKNNKTYATWQEGFLSIFDIMIQDRRFIMNIFHSISLDILYKYLYKLVFPLIYNVVEEKAKGMQVREEDKKFIADFYKYSFVAIVLQWIEDNMKEDPKAIVEHLSILVEGTVDHALRNYSKH